MEMVRLTLLDKKILLLILFWGEIQAFANPLRQYESAGECNFAEKYKVLEINKKEKKDSLIETEIFGKPSFNRIMEISRLEVGGYFSYYFYKVNNENICLGIDASNPLQEKSILYINTQKECGSKCKVYLSEPEEKRIFYLWEPSKEILPDNKTEEIVINTDKESYSIRITNGIKELELNIGDFPKLESIQGLEKFPRLINLSLVGFDY